MYYIHLILYPYNCVVRFLAMHFNYWNIPQTHINLQCLIVSVYWFFTTYAMVITAIDFDNWSLKLLKRVQITGMYQWSMLVALSVIGGLQLWFIAWIGLMYYIHLILYPYNCVVRFLAMHFNYWNIPQTHINLQCLIVSVYWFFTTYAMVITAIDFDNWSLKLLKRVQITGMSPPPPCPQLNKSLGKLQSNLGFTRIITYRNFIWIQMTGHAPNSYPFSMMFSKQKLMDVVTLLKIEAHLCA